MKDKINTTDKKMFAVNVNWKQPKMHIQVEIHCYDLEEVIDQLKNKYSLDLTTAFSLSISAI